jgi:TolB-like protein
MASVWGELKRRNVVRVAVAYAVVAWLLLQVADVVLDNIAAPGWVFQAILLLLIIGFPVALIFAWAFELTPEGLKKEKDVDRSQSITHITGRKFDFAIIGLMAVAILYLALDNYVLTDREPPDGLVDVSQPVPGFSNRAAIAVLPFINLSDDPDQEYFSDGLTEDLITGLQSFRSFPIIARTSTFKYKGTSSDVREIATALGAGYIIEGSVRKVADNVRINVQLNNHEGLHVWAEIYDFKFEDSLHIQTELVSKILLAIEPELIISEADRTRFVRTEDMEAFDYYLRAATNTLAPWAFTDLNGGVVTPERLELAREYATRAVELDPNFAGGWRMLNHVDGQYVTSFSYLHSDEERQSALKRAIEYGDRSRQLSPFEPTVCSCLAAMLLINGDTDRALLLQEEALRQNPSNALVHAILAKILQVTGEHERALEEIMLAKRLSPEDMAMSWFLYFEAAIYQDLGRFGDAVDVANKAVLLSALNFDAEFVKITALYASGQRDLAQAAVARLKSSGQPGFRPVSAFDHQFADAVANNVTLESGASLHGLSYNEGLRLVFQDLGWVDD